MENVNLLLSKASECLIQSLISEMEASQEDVQAIEQVRRSEARLEVPWDLVLRSFRSAVLTAAYEHYTDWYGSGKRKPTATDSSRKKLRSGREVP
ncbi:hypothetical protein JVT61DRAFT_10773 [Boletus reticuloceps]|uniref:Uncharacterized protein n=1 Tax=Boletus reticuloceps TaxID=495285 RepID=A0A8I3A549_9AGAM|nr:hypothetical protein JVT61DRAFT_10773 [Boletus reticuloceps]